MKSHPRKVLYYIFFTIFIDLIGFGMIIPLLPYLGRQLGDSAFKAGLLMSIYSVMQFLLSPLWGQMSDRFGRRPILLFSLLGASISHLAFAFSTHFWGMFISRLMAGSFAANISSAMAAMADISSPQERSQRMGLIGAALGLGFTLGPFAGALLGSLGQKISPQAPFGVWTPALAASILCGLNFISALFFLPETNTQHIRRHFSLSQKLKNIWKGFHRPQFRELFYAYGFHSLAMALLEMSLFLFVKDKYKLTLQQASYGFAYIGLLLALTQGYFLRKLISKFNETQLILSGLLIFSLSASVIPFCQNLFFFTIAITFLSIAHGLIIPSLMGKLSALENPKDQGQIMGTTQSLSALGRIVGPSIAGAIYVDTSYYGPFLLAAIFSLWSFWWIKKQ